MKPIKNRHVIAGINKVFLAGQVGDHGVRTTFLPDSGAMVVRFSLAIAETGGSGQTFTTYVSLECTGKAAESAADLHAGDTVLVEGKLKYRTVEKSGSKEYRLGVYAWSVHTLQQAPVPMA